MTLRIKIISLGYYFVGEVKGKYNFRRKILSKFYS
jgi:hypothetical protein